MKKRRNLNGSDRPSLDQMLEFINWLKSAGATIAFESWNEVHALDTDDIINIIEGYAEGREPPTISWTGIVSYPK